MAQRDTSVALNAIIRSLIQGQLESCSELWQAEHVDCNRKLLAVGAGQQQSTRDEHGAHGISFSPAAGNQLLSIWKLCRGQRRGAGFDSRVLTNACWKVCHD